MKQVQKFPLAFIDTPQSVALPASAPLLRVHMLLDHPHLWALIDTDASTVARFFSIIADGKPVPDGAQHVGTVDYQEFVWHVFETATP